MLKIKHLIMFFQCSQPTAYRKMAFYRAVFGKHNISLLEFLFYELGADNTREVDLWLTIFKYK